MVQIDKIEKGRADLKIKWSDGEESKFNYLWFDEEKGYERELKYCSCLKIK